jgi:hypothetical protein
VNWIVSVAVCPGLSVAGNTAPVTVNPEPVTAAPLIVTAAVPVEDRVSVCVAVELTAILLNVRSVALTLSVGAGAVKTRLKLCALVPVLAVRVAV